MSILFAFLDRDGSNSINREEFLDFGSVLLLNLSKHSDYATFVETHLPSVFRSNFYQAMCKVVKSHKAEVAVEVILVLNALLVAAQDYPQLIGKDESLDPHYLDGYMDTVWEDLETVFTVLYVLEAILKIIVNGWKTYIESPRNAFDFIITVLVVLASAYVYCKPCLMLCAWSHLLASSLTRIQLQRYHFRSKCIQQYRINRVRRHGTSSSTWTPFVCNREISYVWSDISGDHSCGNECFRCITIHWLFLCQSRNVEIRWGLYP